MDGPLILHEYGCLHCKKDDGCATVFVRAQKVEVPNFHRSCLVLLNRQVFCLCIISLFPPDLPMLVSPKPRTFFFYLRGVRHNYFGSLFLAFFLSMSSIFGPFSALYDPQKHFQYFLKNLTRPGEFKFLLALCILQFTTRFCFCCDLYFAPFCNRSLGCEARRL